MHYIYEVTPVWSGEVMGYTKRWEDNLAAADDANNSFNAGATNVLINISRKGE